MIPTQILPVLPLRDVVVYPYMVIPLFVGRKKSINALDAASEIHNKEILLVAQKNAGQDEPIEEDLYVVGTISKVLQLLKLPDGTVKVLVEGQQRARVKRFILDNDQMLQAEIELIEEQGENSQEVEILMRYVLSRFDHYIKLQKKIPPEVLNSLNNIEQPHRLADTVIAYLTLKIQEKQEVLEMTQVNKRLEKLLELLDVEIDLLEMEKKIQGRVKRQIDKNQREYYLNEKIKAIQQEMGEMDSNPNELEVLAAKIEEAGMPKEVKAKALAEYNKLKMMSPMSAEATVIRNYVDWLVQVPWKESTKISRDLIKAEKILDTDHYGLDKVKERILEYLAVQSRVKKIKGPILCLVGPPGVGKTSLGQSIARATGRKFVRIALGGVRDEAEIRGHRRTYIGAMPGKIIQKFAKIKVRNPLFLLDEVDKLAMDFRGDPASALLEVLDPEQNHTFSDHYLEVDYDLSDAMFVATANSLEIPPALLDRMEVIRIPGYTEDEKLHIVKQHLMPKQFEENGLKQNELHISDAAILDVIRHYTREAGVRSLEREIAKIVRKVIRQIVTQKKKSKSHRKETCIEVTPRNIEKYLGVKRFRHSVAEKRNQIGQVTGLAWTEVGGELLTIEAAAMAGKGKATYTGHLGDVMQESIKAAETVVRSRSESLGIPSDFYERTDIHVHVPEGATPKDGPSAGIGMCTALVSVLTHIPVKWNVAMTGEITLRGEVLPIGGLKEKLLAAHRGGIEHVIIPEENQRDLKEIPKNILSGLTIHPVRWIDEVLSLALEEMPKSIEHHDESIDVKKNETDDRQSAH